MFVSLDLIFLIVFLHSIFIFVYIVNWAKFRFDFLTGMKIRRDLEFKLQYLTKTNKKFFISLVDINNLHVINKTKGYREGDKVIKEVANQIKSLTSKSGEYAYRIGGDEFIILSFKNIDIKLSKLNKASFVTTYYNGTKEYNTLFDQIDKDLIKLKREKIKNGEFKDRRSNYI